MKNTTLAVSIVATLAGLGMSSIASGAVVVLNSRAAWNAYVAFQGATVATEDFESFTSGFAASATGTAGGTTWTANATAGLYFGQVNVPPLHQVISTNAEDVTLNFTFAPGVQGIGGEMFGTNADFGVLLARITVTLADGTSYVNDQDEATDFVGFYSNGATISSISVATSTPDTYATVDNLYFATVPAPGALALISLAGVVGGRSRRRANSAAV
jgi:flagellar capping protein FliD